MASNHPRPQCSLGVVVAGQRSRRVISRNRASNTSGYHSLRRLPSSVLPRRADDSADQGLFVNQKFETDQLHTLRLQHWPQPASLNKRARLAIGYYILGAVRLRQLRSETMALTMFVGEQFAGACQ